MARHTATTQFNSSYPIKSQILTAVAIHMAVFFDALPHKVISRKTAMDKEISDFISWGSHSPIFHDQILKSCYHVDVLLLNEFLFLLFLLDESILGVIKSFLALFFFTFLLPRNPEICVFLDGQILRVLVQIIKLTLELLKLIFKELVMMIQLLLNVLVLLEAL